MTDALAPKSGGDADPVRMGAGGRAGDGGAADAEKAAEAFAESVAIMARLRGPGGCPWDREQSFDSIRKHTLEETYEVLDAIERRDWANLKEELGDLVLQVLFYAQMASELAPAEGGFSIAEVLEGLNRKLIRRHPHVFGDEASAAAGNVAAVGAVDGASGEAAAQVLRNWEQIKIAEKKAGGDAKAGLLDGVMRAQPALAEAGKLGSKAAKVGFDWPDWHGLLAKVEEETGELVEAVGAGRQDEVEAELGDLLFTVVNLGRHLHVDAEMALRGTNLRFRERFRAMELAAEKPLSELGPEELEALWARAKRQCGV
ncbi:MAG TPA: nucleoside triphosphate pyrophosphohydrolase [Acidobacteriaceae bacterium]|nr:nucleoside triphosphate pyrophosphohydrolase [Acidobacteriaceae bacterium]